MKNIVTLFVAVLMLGFAGCFTEREPGQGNRAVLKGGQTVAADMDGWVAVPNTAPEMKKGADAAYAVLSTHNVVSTTMDGWVAMDPAYFAKLSGLQAEAPKPVASELYPLKEGRDIPKNKAGWVAVPNSQPTIEKSSRDTTLAMAELVQNQIVPKEMNGWVAVDRATLSKLTEKKMMSGKGADLPKVHAAQ